MIEVEDMIYLHILCHFLEERWKGIHSNDIAKILEDVNLTTLSN
jgi:hypothetical protein